MSCRLAARIKDIRGLPGKYKRVFEAWAAFANNDGTNIFASKESVAAKASVSKWTVFRNTDDLVAANALVEAASHSCKTAECEGGPWHYAGNGHYTRAYNINIAELQNATVLVEKLGSKMLLGQGSKMPKSKVAKSHATLALEATPAALAKNITLPLVPNGKSNQPIHQSTKEPSAPENLFDEGQNRLEPESQSAQPQEPLLDQEWVEELKLFFPRCPATQENIAMLRDILRKLEGAAVWHNGRTVSVGLEDVLNYNWSHFDGKLKLHSLRQTHNAVVNGDPENGVVAQTLSHDEADCRVCKKRNLEAAKREETLVKADPMWKTDPVTEARSLVRKPKTAAERRELLALRGKPKKNWGYLAKFLAQDKCPKCRGQNAECECVLMEEEPAGREEGRKQEPAPYNFSKVTPEEIEKFRLLQAADDGWEGLPIKKRQADGTWKAHHINAAIRHFLDKNEVGMTFAVFSAAMEEIIALDK